jgi:hypothetical protein
MTSRTIRLLRAVSVGCAAAVALGPLAPPTAATATEDSAPVTTATAGPASVLIAPLAVGRDVERRGQCRIGPGEWELEVTARPRRRLRIDFSVHDVARRKKWSVFISDNGRRVAAVNRRTRLDGDFQVRKATRNRRGVDRVWATAVNARSGARCTGHLRF